MDRGVQLFAKLRPEGLSVFRRAVDQDTLSHLDWQKIEHAVALEFDAQSHRRDVNLHCIPRSFCNSTFIAKYYYNPA